MSGWLHPEGPESVATYWSRRVVLIAAVVLALVLGVVLVNGAQGSEPQTAGPAQVTASPVTTSPAPSASPSPSSSSPSSSSPRSASPSSPSPTPDRPVAPAPTTSASSAPSTPATPPCDPAQLRATLQGDPTPTVGQRVVFTLSLINGGDRTCTVERNADTVELKVYSGTDRIWSTADCATLVPPATHVVRPEGAVGWKLTWDGGRSAEGCKAEPEVPRPGTYFATFQFTGAKPVQQRMLLTAR